MFNSSDKVKTIIYISLFTTCRVAGGTGGTGGTGGVAAVIVPG